MDPISVLQKAKSEFFKTFWKWDSKSAFNMQYCCNEMLRLFPAFQKFVKWHLQD